MDDAGPAGSRSLCSLPRMKTLLLILLSKRIEFMAGQGLELTQDRSEWQAKQWQTQYEYGPETTSDLGFLKLIQAVDSRDSRGHDRGTDDQEASDPESCLRCPWFKQLQIKRAKEKLGETETGSRKRRSRSCGAGFCFPLTKHVVVKFHGNTVTNERILSQHRIFRVCRVYDRLGKDLTWSFRRYVSFSL